MGSCSSTLSRKKTSSIISISFLDNSVLKKNIAGLVLRLGCFISKCKKKYELCIDAKNKSLALDYMLKKLILGEKLNNLKEIIKKLQTISLKSKNICLSKEISPILNEIESIENWLTSFKMNLSLKENKLEENIKQFDILTISKNIDSSISQLNYFEYFK